MIVATKFTKNPDNTYDQKDVKITANEYAKVVLYNALEAAFFFDEHACNFEKLTEKEKEEVREKITKHHARISEFLGMSKIREKINK